MGSKEAPRALRACAWACWTRIWASGLVLCLSTVGCRSTRTETGATTCRAVGDGLFMNTDRVPRSGGQVAIYPQPDGARFPAWAELLQQRDDGTSVPLGWLSGVQAGSPGNLVFVPRGSGIVMPTLAMPRGILEYHLLPPLAAGCYKVTIQVVFARCARSSTTVGA